MNRLVSLLVIWVAVSALSMVAWAQNDCLSFTAAARMVQGKKVGVDTCRISEERPIQSASGAAYRRIEMMLGGTLEGYIVKSVPPGAFEGSQFTDHPEFLLAQKGRNPGPYFHGFSRYAAEKGKNGMVLFLPKSAADWNGKLYMVFHGGAPYVPMPELLPRKPNEYNPLTGNNQYVALMVDKGYAVAYTRRPAHKGGEGDQRVVLDDGTIVEQRDYQYHLGLLRDWTVLARNLVTARLGGAPRRIYWYGRSGGAAPGRMFNYVPAANVDDQGRKLFDGMLLDDPAGGWVMPTMYFKRKDISSGVFAMEPDQKDHWVLTAENRAKMALAIDIDHLGYAGDLFVTGSYPEVKREHARLVLAKGLAPVSRSYEIAAVSHGDAGAVYPSEAFKQNLDLSGIFDALIDMLDRWVEHGVEPPATHSDAIDLGDADHDGRIENPAIELPEAACPLGVYREFLGGAKRPGRTGFAAFLEQPRISINADTTPLPPGFDENGLEPLDSRDRPLDMNGNGVRDTRESIGQAWERRRREGKRYGVLNPHEPFTHGKYVSCVAQAATDLYRQGFLSEAAMLYYIEKALNSNVGKPAPAKTATDNPQ